ncbi:MAG: hypothetical protein ACRYG6_07580 [Janthinobacterium lividum]
MLTRLSSKERVTVERQDGSRYEDVPATLPGGGVIFIPDVTIPIAPGDFILRQIQSGLIERYIVENPELFSRMSSPHYQVKVRREGAGAPGSTGHVFHVSGNNARVNIGSTDNSTNTVYAASDLQKAAKELADLQQALQPQNAVERVAVGQLAAAEIAATAGDEGKFKAALAAIGPAAHWCVETATRIGTSVAAAAIEAHIG